MSAENKVGAHIERDAVRSSLPPQGGFTLLELLVAIAFIGVISGILLPALNTQRVSTIKAAMPENLAQIDTALQEFETAQSTIPKNWSELLPHLDSSFVLEGDLLYKDGHSFTLVGAEPIIALSQDASLTKVVKPATKKRNYKLLVEAEPLSPMVGVTKYTLNYKDGSIKSQDDPKLLDEQNKRLLAAQQEGAKLIFEAAKQYAETTPEDEYPVDILADFADEVLKASLDFLAGDDDQVTIDDIVALAGDESLPEQNLTEKYVRYLKLELFGVKHETTDGSNGGGVKKEDLELPTEGLLTWHAFRQWVASYATEPGLRDALEGVSHAAESSEKLRPEAHAAQYETLRHLIDIGAKNEALTLKEAAELQHFLDRRQERFNP